MIEIPGTDIVIHNADFRSQPVPDETGDSPLRFDRKIYNALLKYYLSLNKYSNDYLFHSLNEKDDNIKENAEFRYSIMKNKSSLKSGEFIFLLHGLNERSWIKYLPWAFRLVKDTGKAVVMFPLAYHMNRAPAIWSNPRLMKEVSNERVRLFPDIESSAFANAALSIRLQFSPNRFLLSGIQTFNDIVSLMREIRGNQHPHIGENASADIFGYSIGAFLAEILMMKNPGGLFSDSRLFIFCGGPTLDLMSPVSKAIIDSEAALALRNFYVENEFLKDERINSAFNALGEGRDNFTSMLDHKNMREFRKEKFKNFEEKFMAITLKGDAVMRPEAVAASVGREFIHRLRTEDFEYRYSHENPFPVNNGKANSVDAGFQRIFDIACSFLS